MTAEERQRSGPGGATAPAGFTPLDEAFDGGSLYALRAAVTAHATAAGLSRNRVYDVTAVAHELAANAVLHGAGRGRLRLWTDDKFLYCQVSDDGRGQPADAAGEQDGVAKSGAPKSGAPKSDATQGGPAPWPAEHGHGLWLAGQLADHVSLGHGADGTTATVSFLLRPQ